MNEGHERGEAPRGGHAADGLGLGTIGEAGQGFIPEFYAQTIGELFQWVNRRAPSYRSPMTSKMKSTK
jgi:hypothetical protein